MPLLQNQCVCIHSNTLSSMKEYFKVLRSELTPTPTPTLAHTHTHTCLNVIWTFLTAAFWSGRHTRSPWKNITSAPLRHFLSCKHPTASTWPPHPVFQRPLFHGEVSKVTFASHDLWVCRGTLDEWEQTASERSWSCCVPLIAIWRQSNESERKCAEGEVGGGGIPFFVCVHVCIHVCMCTDYTLRATFICLFVCESLFC